MDQPDPTRAIAINQGVSRHLFLAGVLLLASLAGCTVGWSMSAPDAPFARPGLPPGLLLIASLLSVIILTQAATALIALWFGHTRTRLLTLRVLLATSAIWSLPAALPSILQTSGLPVPHLPVAILLCTLAAAAIATGFLALERTLARRTTP